MDIEVENITNIDVGTMCLQGPCLHTISVHLQGTPKPLQFESVIGEEILRLLVITRNKKRNARDHFMWFLTDSWAERTKRNHLERVPVVLKGRNGKEFTIRYPENVPRLPKYREIKERPRREPKIPATRKGNEWLEKHGTYWIPNISLSDAKELLRTLKGYATY